MKIVALVCLVAFMLTSLVVGLRVLGMWRRTRALPELLLSAALLSVGFLSFAVGTTAKILVSGTEALRHTITLVGLSNECFGVLALIAFSWRVFYPRQRWAAGVAASLAVLVGVALYLEISTGQYLRYADAIPITGLAVPIGLAARSTGPAWMALSCLVYHGKLRKRARLGLAEPFVVHRVALWGIALAASALAYWVGVVHRLVYGTGLKEHASALAIVSLLALVSAIAIGLAFFPPRAYRAWIARTTPPSPES